MKTENAGDKMKAYYLIYFVLFSLMVTIPGNVAGENWSMFRHDGYHHSFTTEPAPSEVELIWKHRVGEEYNGVISSPSIVDGIVYFGSDDGNISALKASDGKVLWKVHLTDYPVRSSPAVDNDKGILIINSDMVYALALSNGSILWNFTTGANWEFSSPLIHEGVVYITSDDGKLYALNETDGGMIWYYDTHSAPRSPNANYGGGGGIGSSPATDGTRIFFACEDNTFYAINIYTHDLDWKYEFGDRIDIGPADYPIGNGRGSYSSPAVDLDAGLVFVGGDDGNLYAFDVNGDNDGWDNDLDGVTDDEGVLVWHYQTDGRILSSPGFHGGKVFFTSYTDSSDNIFAIDESNGARIWSYRCNDSVFSSPGISEGMVVVGSNDYTVYAFNENNGSIIWRFETKSYVASSPAIYNNMVFVGSCDHYLYALGIPRNRPDAAIGPDDLIFPHEVVENTTVNFSCTIHNIGMENITSLHVVLSIDDSSIYVDYISLKMGENLTFYQEWKAIEGNHTVNLSLSECEPAERNLNNNMVSKVIQVTAREENGDDNESVPESQEGNWTYVDFSFMGLSISPELPVEGESINAAVELKNSGNGTGEGTLWLYLDAKDEEKTIYTNRITLSPATTRTYYIEFTTDAGEHTLYAVVECENDTDDENNEMSLHFTVMNKYIEPAPDLNVHNIILMKEGGPAVNVKEGDTLTIQILVSNDGDRDTIMDFYLYDGEPSLNQIISYQSTTLQSGKSRNIFVIWMPLEGNHTIYAVANSRLTDSNIENNMKNMSISVGAAEKDEDSGGLISLYPSVVITALGAAFLLSFWTRKES